MTLLLALATSLLAADLQPITWHDDICNYQGFYDADVLPTGEAKAAIVLIRHSGAKGPERDYSAEDFRKLKVRCEDRIEAFSKLSFPHLKATEELRLYLLKDYRETCAFWDATSRWKKDPKSLPKTNAQSKECEPYRQALTDNKHLKEVWEKLGIERCETNKNPVECRERWNDVEQEDVNTSRRLNVLVFGWGNCMNAHLPHSQDRLSKLSSLALEEFKGRLTHFLKECDEP